MKKFYAVPLAALLVVACSEPTATSSTDLRPRYAKPAPPPTGGGCTACAFTNTYTFESTGIAAANSSFSTELQLGAVGSADAATVIVAPNGQHFVGRFENVQTVALLNVPNGYTRYSLTFDFYAIGSWDGKGKQAQHGVFEANVFSIGYKCTAGGPITSIFASTFSNQLTVQQDYPLDISSGGGFKAATGSYGQELLGYRGDPSSNTPLFRSFSDVEYTLSFSGLNPCGTNAAVTFVFSTSNPLQQSRFDESWGLDNVIIQAGT